MDSSSCRLQVNHEPLRAESKGMITTKDAATHISAVRNQRFMRAQNAVRKVVALLVDKYHVSKIVLIGSLAGGDRFGFHSDIDLCVEGLQDKLYFQAAGESLLLTDEFDVDIIPFENLSPDKRELVMRGKVLYEKR